MDDSMFALHTSLCIVEIFFFFFPPPSHLKKNTHITDVTISNFGRVYKAVRKSDNAIVAIKILPLDEDDEDSIEKITKEIKMLKECDSPYITRYFGSYLKDGNLWVRKICFCYLPLTFH